MRIYAGNVWAILFCASCAASCLASCSGSRAGNSQATSPTSCTTGQCTTCSTASFQGKCVHAGDTVTFGKYPQATHTPEPIEWIVLDVVPKAGGTDGRFLLLSKYVLDAKAYDTSHKDSSNDIYRYPTWAESDIRKWLNGSEFLSSAHFTDQELASIVEVTNSTSDIGSNDGGADTRDKVFLLDREDALNWAYLPNDGARQAYATSYAKENGVSVGDRNCANVQCYAPWWLRSPGDDTYRAVSVRRDGSVGDYGDRVSSTFIGVRPALWVKY